MDIKHVRKEKKQLYKIIKRVLHNKNDQKIKILKRSKSNEICLLETVSTCH